MTGANGTVTSPNYPGHYPTDVMCVWVISVKPSQVIELEFKSLDIEQSKKCRYDSLEILDGSSVSFVLNPRYRNKGMYKKHGISFHVGHFSKI